MILTILMLGKVLLRQIFCYFLFVTNDWCQ